MKLCETCKWRVDGFCTNESKIREGSYSWQGQELDDTDSLIYTYQENGAFYVGPKFGCVHHAEKEASHG